MWSVGIIMYLLLSGEHPFLPCANLSELIQNIKKGEIAFPKEKWANVSDQAKALLRNLLVIYPAARFTARKSLIDKWFNLDEDQLSKNILSANRLKLFLSKQKERESIFNSSWK